MRYRVDVRVALAVLLGGCGGAGAPRPARQPTPTPTPAPAVLELEWAGPPDVSNPGDGERALALFADDEWNRALPCPQSLAERQPAAADRHRCVLRAAALGVGGATLWAGLARFGHEFDGMYGSEEAIVLVDARAPGRPIATLIQWGLEVNDGAATLLQRRFRTADLDDDGRPELCVESITELGGGLFEVMDLTESGAPWRPVTRQRHLAAFTYDAASARLRRVGALDRRCPDRGYAPFVAPTVEPVGDPISGRRHIQGDDAPPSPAR